MLDGFVELTQEKLKTPDGIVELNRMIKRLFESISGDGEKVKIYFGYGTPESAVTANIGSIYMRKDGGANTSVYIKESGNDTPAGWVAK